MMMSGDGLAAMAQPVGDPVDQGDVAPVVVMVGEAEDSSSDGQTNATNGVRIQAELQDGLPLERGGSQGNTNVVYIMTVNPFAGAANGSAGGVTDSIWLDLDYPVITAPEDGGATEGDRSINPDSFQIISAGETASSWGYFILPYIEQQNIYGNYATQVDDAAGGYVLTVVSHNAGTGAGVQDGTSNTIFIGETYVAGLSINHSGGVNILFGDGSVRFVKDAINLTDIRDGTSNTFMVGEAVGGAGYVPSFWNIVPIMEQDNLGKGADALVVSLTADPTNPNVVYLGAADRSGAAAPDLGAFAYGGPGWLPVVGDWDGDGIDTIGVVDPVGAAAPDLTPFAYGLSGWVSLAGD